MISNRWLDQYNFSKCELALNPNTITDEDIPSLIEFLREHPVSSLHIIRTIISEHSASIITTVLSHAPMIRSLNLQNTIMDPAGYKAIAAAIKNTSIETLNLCNSMLTLEVLEVLSKSLPLSIKTLDLSSNALENAGATLLAEALPKYELERLFLTDCGIKADGAKAIVSALPKSISMLDLGRNDIGDIGAECVAAILAQYTFTVLKIDHCHITKTGAIMIANALSESHITFLDIEANPMGDEGMMAIAAALPLSKHLHELRFGKNHSTEDVSALIKTIPQSYIWKLEFTEYGGDPDLFELLDCVKLNRVRLALDIAMCVQTLYRGSQQVESDLHRLPWELAFEIARLATENEDHPINNPTKRLDHVTKFFKPFVLKNNNPLSAVTDNRAEARRDQVSL